MLDELINKGYETMKRRAQNREEWHKWMPWTYQVVEH